MLTVKPLANGGIGDAKTIPTSPIPCLMSVGDSLLLMAVRVNDGLELEVTDPKEHKGDVEQEEG